MTLNIPASEKVFSEIHTILVLISDSLYFGTKKTKTYLNAELPNKKMDPHLGSMLTRFWAKTYLQTHGQNAEDIELKNSPLVGLILRHKNFHIRILKTPNGDNLRAGQTKRRIAFCEQMAIEFPAEDDEASSINLFVLWTADKDFNLNSMSLACPKNADTDNWHQPFPKSVQIESIQSIEENNIQKPKLEFPKDLPLNRKTSKKEIKNDIGRKNQTRQRIKRINTKRIR